MNDFANLEKSIVRELSCRLCLCTDVVKLKPLTAEVKRKMKKLFNIIVCTNDNLPKAICYDCLQQVSAMHLYTVKVEKTQKFLENRKMKFLEMMQDQQTNENKIEATVMNVSEKPRHIPKSPSTEIQHGDIIPKTQKTKQNSKRYSKLDMKYMEAMSLEEFAKTESVDKSLLNNTSLINKSILEKYQQASKKDTTQIESSDLTNDILELDPIVLIAGRPAKQGSALDNQITLFYKMECCICHEKGFNFRSLINHYKDKHGVPGYVTCCEKKFHYFHPKKIIEHMAFHLQPNIFKCSSCHQNFQTSQELNEHQSNGGRSEGKILCPRCSEKFPTYHELGWHVITHRNDTHQCDYCGKILKNHRRKKTVNHMEDLILCSQCIRTLKNIEKQEKDIVN